MDLFWEKEGWEAEDKHLRQLQDLPFRRPFPFIPAKPGLYLIRGPRQIGKSSWLKTMLSSFGRQKKRCFYLSCELLQDYKELAEILKSLKSYAIILLDEINFVHGWDRAVKHWLDQQHDKILVLTGSHAHDLRRGADQMPGRWGQGGEFLLLPMEFDEFKAMRRQASWPELSHLDELQLYFQVGGFPLALLEAGPKGRVADQAMQTYRRWLVGDILKLGKQEVYLRETMVTLAKSLGSAMSLQTLAQKTQMGSHHTAQEYVQILSDCFALKTLYAMDPHTGESRLRKNKKFYFTDPLIFRIALDWGAIAAPENAMAILAEMVAHEHLSRRHARLGYLSTPKGEIDFISPTGWALEVKWSAIPNNLSKAYLQYAAPSKIVWYQGNFLVDWPPA